jgi:hypothetical protein
MGDQFDNRHRGGFDPHLGDILAISSPQSRQIGRPKSGNRKDVPAARSNRAAARTSDQAPAVLTIQASTIASSCQAS